MDKLKFIWFFLVGIYSYIHRGFEIYTVSIQAFANFLTLLLFKHDVVTINVANKWDVDVKKVITYAIHFIVFLFLYFIIF
jgi:hypothetical protein